MPDKTVLGIVGAVFGVIAVLVVIILPMSFQTLEYHEVSLHIYVYLGTIIC